MPQNAYDIVKNFKDYPDFLPWCSGARLRAVDMVDGQEHFTADLVISYKAFCESFTTKVTCDPENHTIYVSYVKGPFKALKSYWQFHTIEGEPHKTKVEFMIDFEFKSKIFQKIVGVFFEEAMRRMIEAFEKRFESIK